MSTTDWTNDADAVSDLSIEIAMNLALGVYGHGSAAIEAMRAEMGRDLTPAEMSEWLENCAEAHRQLEGN